MDKKNYYYKVYRSVIAEALEDHLNSAGRNGGRVVSVTPNTGGTTYTTTIEYWLSGTHPDFLMGKI